MRKTLLAFLFLAICPWLAAQALNNDSIIKMVKAGLSDEVIVSTVQASNSSFDTSTDGLIALKTAGVSDKVIGAMVVKGSGAAPAPAAPSAATASDPNDPGTAHDSGVYLYTTGADGKKQMIFIDRAGAASVHSSNIAGAAFSYGIVKAKMKAEIPSDRAPIRTKDHRPTFYMYFPSSESLGGLGGNNVITSPSQFSLLYLEIKKDHRETAIAKMGFASVSAGVDNKMARQFTSERVKNGVYKVTPNVDLTSGEYAFIASSSTAGTASGQTVVIYDFGID